MLEYCEEQQCEIMQEQGSSCECDIISRQLRAARSQISGSGVLNKPWLRYRDGAPPLIGNLSIRACKTVKIW